MGLFKKSKSYEELTANEYLHKMKRELIWWMCILSISQAIITVLLLFFVANATISAG